MLSSQDTKELGSYRPSDSRYTSTLSPNWSDSGGVDGKNAFLAAFNLIFPKISIYSSLSVSIIIIFCAWGTAGRVPGRGSFGMNPKTRRVEQIFSGPTVELTHITEMDSRYLSSSSTGRLGFLVTFSGLPGPFLALSFHLSRQWFDFICTLEFQERLAKRCVISFSHAHCVGRFKSNGSTSDSYFIRHNL